MVVQIAIADDLTFIGPSASVIAAWEFAATWAPAKASGILAPEPYALKMKIAKCKLFSFAPLEEMHFWFPGDAIPLSVERISGAEVDGGVRFLGAPVGHPDFCKAFCMSLVQNDFRIRREAICLMKDKQSALLLLRYCHVSRFAFTLRTTPTDCVAEAALEMDRGTRAALVRILDLDDETLLSDQQWQQATLPMKLGGLGLFSAEVTSVPAFAGS